MTIQLEPEVEEQLNRLVAQSGVSADRAVNAALREYLQDLEDYADAMAAMREGGPTITLEELRLELGLDR